MQERPIRKRYASVKLTAQTGVERDEPWKVVPVDVMIKVNGLEVVSHNPNSPLYELQRDLAYSLEKFSEYLMRKGHAVKEYRLED